MGAVGLNTYISALGGDYGTYRTAGAGGAAEQGHPSCAGDFRDSCKALYPKSLQMTSRPTKITFRILL